MPATKTEELTDDMTHALLGEARAAGDDEMAQICENVLEGDGWLEPGDMAEMRELCADSITAARAMSGMVPFVRVVP